MDRRGVTTFACLIIAMYCAMYAMAIGKPKGVLIDDTGRPAVVDYVAFWSAGKLTLEHRPEATYDRTLHRAAQDRYLARETGAFPWAYPPTYFVPAALFATLPYFASLAAFTLLTLALYAIVNARILGEPTGALWMLATSSTLWCFWVGQNGFLNAALLGSGLLLIPTRPALAGVMIGLLSYKPHLGLLIPVALAAAGQWRTFTAAAMTTMVLALASLALFGLAPWSAFLTAIAEWSSSVLLEEYGRPYRLQSLFGLLRTIGLDAATAIWLHTGWAAALAIAVAGVWRSPLAANLKAATLATAALLAIPYVFIYDFPVLTIAQAFLIRHMLAHGPVTLPRLLPLIIANLFILMFGALKLPTAFFAALITAAAIAVEAGYVPSWARRSVTTPAALQR